MTTAAYADRARTILSDVFHHETSQAVALQRLLALRAEDAVPVTALVDHYRTLIGDVVDDLTIAYLHPPHSWSVGRWIDPDDLAAALDRAAETE